LSDLLTWLEGQGLSKYAGVLADNEVDLEILPALSEQDLEKIGIPLGARKKLLNALAGLRAGAAGEARVEAESFTPAGGERRQLTVMFCDMVGFTELASGLDPEVLQRIIHAYEDLCAVAITRYAGYVFQRLGDGIVAFFGYPLAHEGEAERAIHAGLEIIKALAKLEVPEVGRLQVRIGIATGVVVVVSTEKGAVGETMNLAARLQGIAQPGSVVVSERVQRLGGGSFRYEDLGEHTLKGISRPARAYRVLGVSEAASRFEAATQKGLTPLVGREQEIGLLRAHWELAQDGEGQVVLLSGEPGLGKSRILSALREQVEARGARVLRLQCSPYYVNSALYPSIDNFERVLRFGRDEPAASKLDKLEALIVKHYGRPVEDVRLIASLLSIPCEDRYGALSLTPQRQKDETLRALVDLTEAAARRAPSVLLYEDVHWADPTTLEVLDLLIDRVLRFPLLIVLTHRPEFHNRWSGHGHVTALNLSRLTRAQSSTLIRNLAGGKALPPDLLEQLLAKTDGVPLFVEELTKSVLESGELRDAGDRYEYSGATRAITIPATLRDSLMARLDRYLPVREIAQIGAAIGREFSYELISAVSPRSKPELDEALAQLTESGLAFRRREIPEAVYTFKHALVRDTAYDSLLQSRRQELHRKIARVIEQRLPASKDTEPELLAHHYTEAGMIQEAVGYWIKAGQRAVDRSAYREALGHLAAGLGLIPSLPPSLERKQQELQLQTARAAALQATQGFGGEETGRAYSRARELCAELGDAPEVFPVLHGVFLFHMLRGETQRGYDAATECLRRAQTQEQLTPLMIGHRSVGSALLHLGKFPEAAEHLRQLCELVESEYQHSSTVHGLSRGSERLAPQPLLYGIHPRTAARAFLSLTLYALGYPNQAHAAAMDALDHAQQLGHLQNLGYALYWSNLTGIQLGEFAAVKERAQRLQALAEHGFSQWAAFGTFQHGLALAALGDTESGIPQMKQGLKEYRALGSVLYLPSMEALLAVALARTQHMGEAMATISDAVARATETRELWFQAELHRLRGELWRQSAPDMAESCFRQALATAQGQGAKSWELRAATSLAHLRCDQGEYEQAHQLLAPVYAWFDEGFETPDLRDAKALLEELETARTG
jgi:class 3 adenylate cyclase/predicted ATPase